MINFSDKEDEEFVSDDQHVSDIDDDFSTEESSEPVSEAPEPPVSEDEEPTHSDMLYAGVLIALLLALSYGLYRVYSSYFSSSLPDKPAQSVPKQPIQPLEASNTLSAEENQANIHAMVQKASTTLVQEGDRRDEEIQKLEDDLDEHNEARKEVHDSIDLVSKKVEELMESREQLLKEIQAVRELYDQTEQANQMLIAEVARLSNLQEEQSASIALLIDKTTKKKKEKATPPKTYTVVATVEGRAWLEDSNGVPQTVKVGDTLQDYGKIVTIDAISSRVTTSSGRFIEPKPY